MLKKLFSKIKKKLVKTDKIKCIHTTTDCEECISASYCTYKDKNIVHVKIGDE